eukprot:g38189.t1
MVSVHILHSYSKPTPLIVEGPIEATEVLVHFTKYVVKSVARNACLIDDLEQMQRVSEQELGQLIGSAIDQACGANTLNGLIPVMERDSSDSTEKPRVSSQDTIFTLHKNDYITCEGFAL